MYILICGGCGFIGIHLCKELLRNGKQIICLDNLFTGKYENIKVLIDNPNFIFIQHDIIQPLHSVLKDYQISEIYNLACPASPPKYQYNPLFTINTCFIGTQNVLEVARDKGAKILLASTSEIYGEPKISPQHEEYRGNVNTLGIRSCYVEGKRIGETLMMEYYRIYKIDTKIVRIFNTYGPYMDINDGRVVSTIINQALSNKNITIYGDGSQTLSFCYISDLIEGIILLMASNCNYPINIGNDQSFTIKQLVDLVISLTKSKVNIDYKCLPKDDPTNRKPDINKANIILHWKPNINLVQGITNTIRYFKNMD